MTADQIAIARKKAECALEAYSSRCLGHTLGGLLLAALDEVERLQVAKLRVFCVKDANDGRTWVIAENANEALGMFCCHEGFEELRFCELEITLVDAGEVITVTAEECDGGDKAYTAERWCAERGKCVLCSTWWEA